MPICMAMKWSLCKITLLLVLLYCAGYACGYHLVKHYLNKTGESIAEATILPASEILDCVEDFGTNKI